MGEDNHGYTRCVGRTSHTKHDQTNSSKFISIENIPQAVLQEIIQMVKEELRADEQEQFKETLKMEARAKVRTAVNSAFTDLMSETFTEGHTEQSKRVSYEISDDSFVIGNEMMFRTTLLMEVSHSLVMELIC
ncbi:hypothetical protein M9H77_03372 [Catharanthus roseus]|uniref:Uncharacterized protein n=1 Tax=Catharanthus roseus TaxID=4058 RepID=A0ACC0CB11_CATRO|nr:hypothetical protein M9H77_03372 [Catharanthus roseus]